jgi:hypothetical protein
MTCAAGHRRHCATPLHVRSSADIVHPLVPHWATKAPSSSHPLLQLAPQASPSKRVELVALQALLLVHRAFGGRLGKLLLEHFAAAQCEQTLKGLILLEYEVEQQQGSWQCVHAFMAVRLAATWTVAGSNQTCETPAPCTTAAGGSTYIYT